MSYRPHPTILPLYARTPPVLPTWRRILGLVAQLLIAAAYGVAAVVLPPDLIFVLGVPIALCLLFTLWLMPDRSYIPLKSIFQIYRCLLILTVIWPVYLAVVLPGLPWLTPTRAFLFLLTAVFLYSAATSGQLRSHIAIVIRSSPPFWAAFLLWQASLYVTLPFSSNLSQSLKMSVTDELRLAEMLFLGCFIFTRRGESTRTIGWLIVLAVICAVDGFIEAKLQYPPWANHIPSFLRVDDTTLSGVLGSQARSADGLYRTRGPFVNSLVFAEYLAICETFVLHWLLSGRTLLLRVAMAVTWVVLLAAILITQSRLGLVGVIVGLLIYVPLWAYRRWRADPTSIFGPTILFGAPIIALALMGIVFSSHTATTRILGGGAQQASTAAREEQRRLAIPKVLRNPVGYGRGSSGRVIGFVSPAGITTVDNHYLTTLIDLGMLGFIGFYGMFLVAAWLAIQLYLKSEGGETELSAPLAAVYVMFLVVKSVLSEETNHGLFVLLLAMVLALRAREIDLSGLYSFGAATTLRKSSREDSVTIPRFTGKG